MPNDIVLYGPSSAPAYGGSLPHPTFGDVVEANVNVNFKKTMDNKTYSYVNDSGQKKLTFQFKSVHRYYVDLIIELMHNCINQWMVLIDHNGTYWQVKFANPTFEFALSAYTEASECPEGQSCTCAPQEHYDFTLELVGCVMT